jgi:hypothetical protein
LTDSLKKHIILEDDLDTMMAGFKKNMDSFVKANKMDTFFRLRDKLFSLFNEAKEYAKPKSKQLFWCCTCNKYVKNHAYESSHPLFYGDDAKRAREVYVCRNSKKTRKCTCGAHISRVMALDKKI